MSPLERGIGAHHLPGLRLGLASLPGRRNRWADCNTAGIYYVKGWVWDWAEVPCEGVLCFIYVWEKWSNNIFHPDSRQVVAERQGKSKCWNKRERQLGVGWACVAVAVMIKSGNIIDLLNEGQNYSAKKQEILAQRDSMWKWGTLMLSRKEQGTQV